MRVCVRACVCVCVCVCVEVLLLCVRFVSYKGIQTCTDVRGTFCWGTVWVGVVYTVNGMTEIV